METPPVPELESPMAGPLHKLWENCREHVNQSRDEAYDFLTATRDLILLKSHEVARLTLEGAGLDAATRALERRSFLVDHIEALHGSLRPGEAHRAERVERG